jgi:hypothetical protein
VKVALESVTPAPASWATSALALTEGESDPILRSPDCTLWAVRETASGEAANRNATAPSVAAKLRSMAMRFSLKRQALPIVLADHEPALERGM